MSSTVPAVLVAAGGVGLAHSVLPDHWVPLALIARTRHDSLPRVARLSLLAGLAHVVVSLALGAIVVAVGLTVRSTIESRADLIVGGVLVATGIAFAVIELLGHRHHHDHQHHHHDNDHHGHDAGGDTHHGDRVHGGPRRGLAVLIPFGAAASPDLTILPVFLAAATLGAPAAAGSLAVFAAVTIATFVGLTTLATATGYRVREDWVDRYANLVTAAVLVTIGTLIVTHVL